MTPMEQNLLHMLQATEEIHMMLPIINSHNMSMIKEHLIQTMIGEGHLPKITEANILQIMTDEDHQVMNMIEEEDDMD